MRFVRDGNRRVGLLITDGLSHIEEARVPNECCVDGLIVSHMQNMGTAIASLYGLALTRISKDKSLRDFVVWDRVNRVSKGAKSRLGQFRGTQQQGLRGKGQRLRQFLATQL